MFRRILLSTVALVAVSGAAFAADLPSRSAPPVYIPPPPIFSWTGFYVGGQIGYEWGTSTSTAFLTAAPAVTLPLPNYSANGVTGGAHIGYNYQVAQFVFGLEGDVNGSGYKGTLNAGPVTLTTREDIAGSLRGRVGLAWDRALFYGTGGVAFAPIRNQLTIGAATDAATTTRVGWTAGGGVEYAVTNNWSVRAEYRRTDYGSYSFLLANTTAGVVSLQKHEFDNAVWAGFSYKFGEPPPPAPIIAKY